MRRWKFRSWSNKPGRLTVEKPPTNSGNSSYWRFDDPEPQRTRLLPEERDLRAAVILRAMKDLRIHMQGDSPGKIAANDVYDAYHWFFGEPLPLARFQDLWSLESVCEHLDLNVHLVRKMVREMIPEGLEIPERKRTSYVDKNGVRRWASQDLSGREI